MTDVLIIAGPTAVGKTDITLALAEQLNGEIVSADSMQVYRHMDIGSAKPSREELARVPHHLIDVADPDQPFTVADFQRLATEAIRDIQRRGKRAVVSGGTGLYINALLYAMDFSGAGANEACRRELEEFARMEGAEALHRRLAEQDPESAAAVHPNNVKRVIRALEIVELSGTPKGDFRGTPKLNAEFSFVLLCLTRPREELYDRINKRVDLMLSSGLLAEVEQLRRRGYHKGQPAMQGIGYKELLAFMDGEYGYEEAIDRIKKNTRHYAKRQMTWFSRYSQAHWVDVSAFSGTGDATEAVRALL